MSRATQFTVIVAVAGLLVLGAGSARPQPPSYRTLGPSPAIIAQAETRDRARAYAAARASRDAIARALGPGFCFAGRPCPAATAAVCYAGATFPATATVSAKATSCPKAEVTYRFADSPRDDRR